MKNGAGRTRHDASKNCEYKHFVFDKNKYIMLHRIISLGMSQNNLYEKRTESDKNKTINYVAEEQARYFSKKHTLINYTDRPDMNAFEKVCCGNYQDVHPWNEQKIDWSFEIPEEWRKKTWCYAMNTCCRSLKF